MGDQSERGRVIGIGGLFFKSPDQNRLRTWYQEKMGLPYEEYGVTFRWRAFDDPSREQRTAWSIFPGDTDYFEPGKASFMVNYVVDDLDAFLAKLTARGVEIDPKREDYAYGRFAWILDPDGNKIELWEPAPPAEA